LPVGTLTIQNHDEKRENHASIRRDLGMDSIENIKLGPVAGMG